MGNTQFQDPTRQTSSDHGNKPLQLIAPATQVSLLVTSRQARSGSDASSALSQHFPVSRNVPLGPSMQLGRSSRSESKFSLQIEGNKGLDRPNNLLGVCVYEGDTWPVRGGTGRPNPKCPHTANPPVFPS